MNSPLQPDAIDAVWRLARENRWLDVGLLDQRIRLMLERCHPKPKSLSDLAERFGEQSPEATPRHQTESEVCQDVTAIFQLFHAMKTDETCSHLFLDREQSPAGPLGIGIDVQGAIAIDHNPEADLKVDHADRRQIVERCEQIYAEACQELYDDHLVRRCFRWDGRQIARDERGRPQQFRSLLEERLRESLNQIRDSNGRPFLEPRDDKGRISLVPDHWALFTNCHPRLKAWADMVDSAALLRYFRSDATFYGNVSYELVPYLRARMPPLSAMTRFRLPQPQSPAPQTFRVTLADFELRCLAVTVEKYNRESRLCRLFYDQEEFGDVDDIREVLATEVYHRMKYGEPHGDPLPPDEREKWLDIVNVLLFAIPRMLSQQEIRTLLAEKPTAGEFSATECERLEQIMKNKLGATAFLVQDRTIDDMCDHLEIEPMDLYRELAARGISVETADAAIRNFVFGWSENPQTIREALFHLLPAESEFREALEDDFKLDQQILWRLPVTSNGRFGMPALGTQSRIGEFQQLKDDFVKQVAFALVASEHVLIAVEEDGFLLRSDTGGAESIRQIKKLVRSTLRNIIPDFPFVCEVETFAD